MNAAELVGLAFAAVGLGMAGSFVWATVRSTRRALERGRRAVQPAKVRALSVRGVVDASAASRRDLARDVLRARQAYDLARRDGRPVAELEPTVVGLEKLARSLDVDLRMRRPVHDEVERTRKAADAVTVACAPAPGRDRLLSEVTESAERARLAAEALRELP